MIESDVEVRRGKMANRGVEMLFKAMHLLIALDSEFIKANLYLPSTLDLHLPLTINESNSGMAFTHPFYRTWLTERLLSVNRHVQLTVGVR